MRNVILKVFVLLLAAQVVSGWKLFRSSELPKVPGTALQEVSDYDGELIASVDSLPEKFYAGDMATDSRCMLAYTEMGKFCGSISETKRMRLAALLASCHLEGAGRKPIIWHPDHKLGMATEGEISLVTQYVPLLRTICDRTGNGYDLALFRMQVDTDLKLLSTVEDLRDAVAEARQVNMETQTLASRFKLITKDSQTWSHQIKNITGQLEGTTNSLTSEYRDLESIEQKINNTVRTLAHDNEQFSNDLMEFLRKAYEHVDFLADGAQLQREYNQLSSSCGKLQEEIIRISRVAESCQREMTIRATYFINLSRILPKVDISMWVEMAQDLWEVVLTWIMFPFTLLKHLQIFKTSGWVSPKFRLLFELLQAPLYLSASFLLYKMSMLLSDLSVFWNPAISLVWLGFELLRKTLAIVLYPSKALYDLVSTGSAIACTCGSGSQTEIPVNLLNALHANIANLDHRLSSCIAESVADLEIGENIKGIVGQLEQMIKDEMFGKMYRVEKRQIHIFESLQNVRKELHPRRSFRKKC